MKGQQGLAQTLFFRDNPASIWWYSGLRDLLSADAQSKIRGSDIELPLKQQDCLFFLCKSWNRSRRRVDIHSLFPSCLVGEQHPHPFAHQWGRMTLRKQVLRFARWKIWSLLPFQKVQHKNDWGLFFQSKHNHQIEMMRSERKNMTHSWEWYQTDNSQSVSLTSLDLVTVPLSYNAVHLEYLLNDKIKRVLAIAAIDSSPFFKNKCLLASHNYILQSN